MGGFCFINIDMFSFYKKVLLKLIVFYIIIKITPLHQLFIKG